MKIVPLSPAVAVPLSPAVAVPLYAFGMSLALPGMTMSTLDIFPRMRGLAASLQNFVQMVLFALVSGFVAPLLFDSAFKLAMGQAAAVVLAAFFWWLGTRQTAAVGVARRASFLASLSGRPAPAAR